MHAEPPIASLIATLRKGPPLRLAVLFGSGARGRLRPDSDLDVAILPVDPALSLGAELALQRSLEESSAREVDLVRLDQASTLLRWEVARDGKLLLEGLPGSFTRFRAQAMSEFLEFAPDYDRVAEVFRQRLVQLGGSPA